MLGNEDWARQTLHLEGRAMKSGTAKMQTREENVQLGMTSIHCGERSMPQQKDGMDGGCSQPDYAIRKEDKLLHREREEWV